MYRSSPSGSAASTTGFAELLPRRDAATTEALSWLLGEVGDLPPQAVTAR
jgi:hypothetical protein